MKLYKMTPYDQLKDGDMVQFFGVHVLKWERMFGRDIEPDFAFIEVDVDDPAPSSPDACAPEAEG